MHVVTADLVFPMTHRLVCKHLKKHNQRRKYNDARNAIGRFCRPELPKGGLKDLIVIFLSL